VSVEKISPKELKNMFISGAKYLESKKNYVDELNVFPVPDGDTGTNMTLTILSAVKEVMAVESDDLEGIAKAISSGSLRGARGNSGVILSQIFRGFFKEITQHEEMDSVALATALQQGSDTAYKAVMKPKEGTILTVIREIAEKAAELAIESDNIVEAFKEIIDHGEATLQYTPELLPVLKEAGVVDSGGQGLMYVFRGALMALEAGEDYVLEFEEDTTESVKVRYQGGTDTIKFGYCTEFIVNIAGDLESDREANGLRTYLETLGDSIVVVADDEIIKVHVHTDDPGLAIQKGLSIGELSNLKIDNMREEHANRLISQAQVDQVETVEEPKKLEDWAEYGFVVISIGAGLTKIFKSLGADKIVEGGQTMNPSTEDILAAVDKVYAKHVFILPNNKNIILAAQQVQSIVKDKEVHIIPSQTIPQGIGAMIEYDSEESATENEENMIEALSEVISGQVTYAVRDTVIEQKEIHEGDMLGIGEGRIEAVEKDPDISLKVLLKSLIDEDSELITIYYGQDITQSHIEQLQKELEADYPTCQIESHYGGQPLYYYILSVE